MNKKEKEKKNKGIIQFNHCHYIHISTGKYGLCEFLLIELD